MYKNRKIEFILHAIIILLAGCRQEPVACPPVTPASRGQLNGLISEDTPIQFPLDDYTLAASLSF